MGEIAPSAHLDAKVAQVITHAQYVNLGTIKETPNVKERQQIEFLSHI